jgi:hypothetical protein
MVGVTVTRAERTAQAAARKQASAYLAHLLETNPAYRRRWEISADRVSRKTINRTAVARVLMAFLNDTGEGAAEIGDERQLLDLVCRALDGTVLTPRTIHWFCRAFDIQVHHRNALEGTLEGTSGSSMAIPLIVTGNALPLSSDIPEYRTVSLQEWHTLGPDGRPLRHRTVHRLQAITNSLDRYPYRFDTSEVEVAAVRGARPGPVIPTERPGIHRVDFLFDKPSSRERRDRSSTTRPSAISSYRYRNFDALVFRPSMVLTCSSSSTLNGYHPCLSGLHGTASMVR